MKRTYDANIGGTIFHVEEDAYTRLQEYLESVKAHFRSYPDSADIVADIESRIAEQCVQRSSLSRVVTLADVEAIIGVMGSVDQFGDTGAPSRSAAPPEPAADTAATTDQPGRRSRRWLRDPDHGLIGGVAAGIARTTGTAPRWVRLVFLAPIPFMLFLSAADIGHVGADDLAAMGMFELSLYLILWLLIPTAKAAAPADAVPPGRRRLFRDPDQMLIAGVAAGIARYCGAAPRTVRIALVVPVPFLIFMGMTEFGDTIEDGIARFAMLEVIAYFLLWLFIPLAKTSIDKLQMRGYAVTLASVAQQAREEDMIQPSHSGMAALMSGIGLSIRMLVLGTVWLTGILLAVWTVVATLGLTVFLTMVLTNPAIVSVTRELAVPKALGFKFYPFVVCSYLLMVIPLVLIGTVVVTELQKRRGVHWNRPASSVYIAAMAVWMVALIAWAWLWASSVKPRNGMLSYGKKCQILYDPTGVRDSAGNRGDVEVLADGERTTIVLRNGSRVFVQSDGVTPCTWSSVQSFQSSP